MSSPYEPEKFIPTIDAILSVANLEEITVNKIRNALQELFGVDLKPYKKEIKQVILNRFDALYQKRKDDEEKERLQEIERSDAILAAQLSRQGNSLRSSRASTTKPKQRTKRAAPANPNVGFNRELVLSAELSDIVGSDRMSRPQVVKQLWAYIKDNQLQVPTDKRQIDCDAKLQKLFKKNKVGAFEMNKFLSGHMFKPDEISSYKEVPNGSQSAPDSTGELESEVEKELASRVKEEEEEVSEEG